MSTNLKAAFFVGALTVIASSTGSYVSAQAISNPSNDQPQTAESAAQKATRSFSLPRVDNLYSGKNITNEQPDQPTPSQPVPVLRVVPGAKGAVPPAQSNVRHLEGRVPVYTQKKTPG